MKKIAYKILGWYFNKLAFIAPQTAARQAFRLFCYPMRPALKQNHIAFLNAGKSDIFTYKQDKIQVYKWGNGPKKILFLHGWQSHSFRWKSYVEAIRGEAYTLYALDAPGHGYSTGNMLHLPLYSEVIEHFIAKTGPFDAIVGHSMGCFAIAHSLYRQPQLRPCKLVFLGSPGEGLDFVRLFKKFLNLNDHTIHIMLDYFQSLSGKSMDFFSLERFGKALKGPGLIIHEKTDKEAPYKYAMRLHEIWENSTLLYTEGLSHNLKDASVVSAVKSFIEMEEKEIIPIRQPKKLAS